MFLLDKEKILLEYYPSRRFTFYVTNFRVRLESKAGFKLNITSIMLEKISSIELVFQHNYDSIIYGLIMLGLLAGVGTWVGEHFADPKIIDIGWYGGLVCLAIGLLLYIPTRSYQINFSSPTATISLNVRGLPENDIQEMIEVVEQAKINRDKLFREAEKPPAVKKIILKQSGTNEPPSNPGDPTQNPPTIPEK